MTHSRLESALTTHETVLRMFNQLPGASNARATFATWAELAALALVQTCSPVDEHWHARTTRYNALCDGLKQDELVAYDNLFDALINAMENSLKKDGYTDDVLGRTFEALDMGNERRGQFFTPMSVCRLNAEIALHDAVGLLETQPIITLLEPAAGAGRLVMCAADVLKKHGHDPAHRMHATAIDVDKLCFWMTYVNLSLCAIPAKVVHGNALTMEEFEVWYTPMHFMGGWHHRVRAAKVVAAMRSALVTMTTPEPTSGHEKTNPARLSLREKVRAKRKGLQ